MNIRDIENFIREEGMLKEGDIVVAGISGGADSVCLLHVLSSLKDEIGYDIHAVHVNHMIRGAEADRDENFVKELGEKLGVPVTAFHKDIPKIAAETGMSCEEAGRKERYDAFAEIAEDLESTTGRRVRIAVAHNKDDMVETVLFNMARGSSLKGLAGIRPVRENIIRPLLFAGRDEIESYLEELGQDYVTDSTNLEDDYTRNRIRHVIIPALKDINQGAVDHIYCAARDTADVYAGIERKAGEFVDSFSTVTTQDDVVTGISFSIIPFELLSDAEQSEAVLAAMERVAGKRKDITRKHIDIILDLTRGSSGRGVDLPYDISARRTGDTLIIEKRGNEENSGIEGTFKKEIFNLVGETHFTKNMYTEIVDYDKIKGVVRVRRPETGDSIVINDKGGRKKLSKLFTDLKVDRTKRDSWPVVVDDDDVVWVPGLRLSEAYKLDKSSTKAIRLEYILEGGNPDE